MTLSEDVFNHVSVLAVETIHALNIQPDGVYVDGTLGGGGHGDLICRELSEDGVLIGIDRDKEAISAAKLRLHGHKCRRIFVNGSYSDIKDILTSHGVDRINGALLDLGVSSYQLDNAARGFSYMNDAPLDMRMNTDDILTAETVVNTYSREDLTKIISKYGEERWAARISKFIAEAREKKPITSTGQLTEIIKAAIPASARRDGPHPSKRTFQAIRIEVNDELSPIERALDDFVDVLESRGRLAVISFHSLEDRIVKNVFRKREDPCICPKGLPECICGKVGDGKRINKKPVTPGIKELENNPRSRSAKLRILEKI